MHELLDSYEETVQLIAERQPRLLFSVDRYHAFGVLALIAHQRGQDAEAHEQYELAFAAASETNSGFRYHKKLGLVEGITDGFVERLAKVIRTRH